MGRHSCVGHLTRIEEGECPLEVLILPEGKPSHLQDLLGNRIPFQHSRIISQLLVEGCVLAVVLHCTLNSGDELLPLRELRASRVRRMVMAARLVMMMVLVAIRVVIDLVSAMVAHVTSSSLHRSAREITTFGKKKSQAGVRQ